MTDFCRRFVAFCDIYDHGIRTWHRVWPHGNNKSLMSFPETNLSSPQSLSEAAWECGITVQRLKASLGEQWFLATSNRPISQYPRCICQISHSASFCSRNVHISVTKWCIVVCGTCALWDLCNWSTLGFGIHLESDERGSGSVHVQSARYGYSSHRTAPHGWCARVVCHQTIDGKHTAGSPDMNKKTRLVEQLHVVTNVFSSLNWFSWHWY